MWSSSADKPESGYISLGYTLRLCHFLVREPARNSAFSGRENRFRHNPAPVRGQRYDFLRLLINDR